ncbi:CHASE2 domain-containing protein, partial [Leptolyngbya sp. FACHB-711]
MELMALDQMVRLRPSEPADSRIVLVTIDESDIQQLGQWPMSDAVLAQVISSLKQQQPRVIGLDIFRDLPVEPGHQALVEVFTSTPNLIGIEKVIETAKG